MLFGCIFCLLLPLYSNAADVLPIKTTPNATSSSRTYIEFSIVNDLGEDYPFFLGGPNQISKGSTRTFNCPEGTDIFHVSAEGDRGKEWFSVNPDMQGQTYLLSGFIHDKP
jgi:hypothetical protein